MIAKLQSEISKLHHQLQEEKNKNSKVSNTLSLILRILFNNKFFYNLSSRTSTKLNIPLMKENAKLFTDIPQIQTKLMK